MKWFYKAFLIMIMIVLLSLAGCSTGSKNESTKMEEGSKDVMDSSQSGSEQQAALLSEQKPEAEKKTEKVIEIPNQMVIYQAELQLRIDKFDQTVRSLEEKAENYGGYIAESTVSREGSEQVSGSLTIRIPQKHFQEFLHDAEGQAAEVLQRNITGQDITEEYIDLESRLKSKKTVEERLLTFMKGAAKTEDLLKISADLAAVQEEIEKIEGKMKFLENKTALSTINITLYENKVIPNIDKDKLNTWDKTKKQFMKSTNMLLAAISGLIVFIFGNLPLFISFAIPGLLGILFYRKRKSKS